MGHLRKLKRAYRHLHPLPAKPPQDTGAERIDLDPSELEAILARAKTALSEKEYTKLHAAMEMTCSRKSVPVGTGGYPIREVGFY
jgi:hypothetical protein